MHIYSFVVMVHSQNEDQVSAQPQMNIPYILTCHDYIESWEVAFTFHL